MIIAREITESYFHKDDISKLFLKFGQIGSVIVEILWTLSFSFLACLEVAEKFPWWWVE